MALGTISKPVSRFAIGNRKMVIRDVTLTTGANYTTGGETITASAVGLRKIEQAIASDGANASGDTGLPVSFRFQSDGSVKILAYDYNGANAARAFLAEVAANANLSSFTARVTFIGY